MNCKDKEGSTHHHACDCREEHFRELESKLAKAQKVITFLNVNTANWSAKYQTLEIERDEALKKLDVARGALQVIERHDAHSYEDEDGTIHHPECDPCAAKEALGRMGG